jgi:DNA-binding NarL/FixJ family response regulator
MKPNILLVDNCKTYREALRNLLAGNPAIGIVTEAGDGVEALAKASETLSDVVCMDVTMPCMNGIEATRRLVAAHPGVKVIAVTTHSIKEYILAMLKAGAVGYLTKGDAGKYLLPAIRAVLRQETYLCPMSAAAIAVPLAA